MEIELVPIVMFLVIAFCFWAVYHYKNREKEKIQDTICKAIDAGQQLSPETIQALGVRSISATFADLRKAVLFFVVGIAVLILAQFIPDDEAPQMLSGLAGFPIMIGIGYFIVYRLGLKQQQ